ncbi:MAG TPA: pyridoxamine 5'-phosphate oxidase family protein [Longimicrobiales bacterium]|nr:pyridoxamine 5'-phosphate oxidase family protein [Longimicrobiales bacterium]
MDASTPHAPGSPPAPEGAAAPGHRRPRALSRQEIDALIRRQGWGVLATSVEDRPYAVPVVYAYDGDGFVIANAPGKKATNLAANPFVCLTITDVKDPAVGWSSVVVLGRARPIERLAERLAAFELLRRQRRSGGSPRLRDAALLARAIVVRIEPEEITGRTTDPV